MRKMMLFTGFALAAVMAVPVYAQVGQDMKNAGHDTKEATVTGAHKTAHGTKKVYHKTESGTKTGYHKTVSGTKHVGSDVGHDTKVTAGKTAYNTRKLGDKIAGKPTSPHSEDPHYGKQ